MQPDPISFIRLLKECFASEMCKQELKNWLNLTVLLNIQLSGHAVSNQLILQLKDEFPRIVQLIAELDSVITNQTQSQQLFKCITDFYTWLNTLAGKSAQQIEEQWHQHHQATQLSLHLTAEDAELLEVKYINDMQPSEAVASLHATNQMPNKYD